MLERLIIRNFKRFEEVEVELGDAVLLIGPNNSGKTSTLQALALWQLGVQRWQERRGEGTSARKRSGVAINRRDLVSIPVPEASLFWRDLKLRRTGRKDGKQTTENVRIEIEVQGVSGGSTWACGLEFDFANSESIYCRPLGWAANGQAERPGIPEAALEVRVAYLPPMSGLAANEVRLDPGAVQVRLGEGRTAEVLRNLCFRLHQEQPQAWRQLASRVKQLFGVDLDPPEYIGERGEVSMSYHDLSGVRLDLSASGRGLQQTLLLLSYAATHPRSVLLLDEPDAHLEILRQRQIYNTLTDLAHEQDCQLIAASHSEVLLNEAADRDVVVAFVGEPHRIDDRGSQVLKALRSIGFEHYYQAEQMGWVLYLEGATDLAILRAFAATLEHPAAEHLSRPFVHYVENQASKAEEHFFGLREAKPELVGLLLLDRQEASRGDRGALRVLQWQRREIENYLCFPEVLEAYAAEQAEQVERSFGPLFAQSARKDLIALMRRSMEDQVPPAAWRDRDHAWWRDVKASDEFLDRVFAEFFSQRELPNRLRKTDYHVLARLVPGEQILPEVIEKLDAIVATAREARPRQ